MTYRSGLKTAILVRLGRVQMACEVLRLGGDLQAPSTPNVLYHRSQQFGNFTHRLHVAFFSLSSRVYVSGRTAVLIGCA